MASSSKEKQNFQCVTEASLDLIKLPLKDILRSQIKPEDLFQKINSSLLSRRIKLRPDQLKLCCFPPPDIPDYSKFDVTLLYTLIRNLCTCPGLEPSRGWGNEPGPKDTQIGDDIERLRLFRNINYAHLSSAAIPDDTFKELYETLKSVFNRLKSHPGCSVDYEQELIETKCLKFRYEKWDTGRFFLENYMERDKRAGLPYEPDISINGKDEVICGDSVEFQANVDQSVFPVWSITWQKRRGENIRCIDISEEKYSGSTNTKLLIRSACKGDEGEYSAFLSRESNRKKYTGSNTISLLVIGELPFLNDLEVSTEEEKIIIHYNYGVLEKSPSVQHIEWRKNDKLLNLEKEKYIGGNLQAKTFTIISPSKDDRGIYSCTVKNAVGPVTKFVNFDIPRVELSVESNGFFGSKATIRCMVSSCPLPEKVQWQKSKDKRVFLSIDITAPAYIGSRDVPKSAILVIPKISFDDKLFYRLLVWNKIGQNYSNIIYLNVTGSPPNITVSQETNINNRSVKLCGNVFVYDNSPCILGVYWTKDGEKIDIKENGGRFSQVTVDEPSLNIKDVNLDDIGDYQLTATNAVGSTKSDVIKLGPPSLLLEKQKDESTGRLRFTLTIQSFPAPCHIQWSAKVNDDDIFTPIDINAEEYKGTTEYLPHPVLVVNQGNQLEKYTFKVEVNSFVGSTIELFSGQKYPSIIKKEGSLENTLYKDKGAGLKFAILNNDLANQFPVEKLKLLKFIIQSSGKVEDVTSLKSADSAMECFIILQDENIFSKRDVIFIQFLCKVTECKELYEKCKDYALSQNALCYFERQIENGYTNVQFHVQGDLNNYTKENIQNIVETVAGILNCRTDEILVNGVHHSRSFMLVLSLKDIYTSKLMTLSEQDCHHLTRQHIDYFILNQKIFQLASSKDLVESKITVLDEELQFAKLCGDLANDFPLQKFQQLRSILSASKKTRNMESLMAANSVLECFTILLDENLFSKADVSLIQFLCKETNCEELHNKCAEYSRGQEIHFCKEDKMELDENWMKFFQAGLVYIQEKNDPEQALAYAWQLYSSGEKYYSELEEEDTALNIYRHCSILLNLINEKGKNDPFLRTKCFYREKLLSSQSIDPSCVWNPFLFDPGIILVKKIKLLRDIWTMIDEYSDVEHINVWPCRLEIKISYENLLGFYREQSNSIDFINRERFNYFIQSGWKLLEKNHTKLVCRMCQSINRSFDQLPNSKSLELLKLWADALEKDGNIELAIKKAQEANDKDLVARLNQELEDLESDSEPDEEWIRGTLAEDVTKSLEQAKGREKSPKKKRRSRPKWKHNDEHLDQSTTTVHSIIADVTSHITNWKDVTEFDLPVNKPRRKRKPCQLKNQHQKRDQPLLRSKVARSINKKAASTEDKFDQLPSELPAGYSSGDESSSDDNSFSMDEAEQNLFEPLDGKTFYEDSCKVYNTKGLSQNIDDCLLTNGLDLSDECVSGMTVNAKSIYDEMRSPDECIDLCKKIPGKYKLCRIEIFNSHRAVCRTVNDNIEIEISGRSKCGKVFNQDEVVVELFECRKKLHKSQSQSGEDDKVYGKVIGQIKTNENRPKYPVLVCTLDHFCMYHMKPLCKTVPKIHILSKKRDKESQVEIYKYTKQTKKLTFDRLKTIDQSKRGEYLFLVCFISWNGMYPLGAVIGVFDGNRDIQTSIRLVCLRNNVSVLYQENTVRETEKILSQMPDQNDEQNREDYSDSLNVFTIDGNDTKDLDDAISVQIISENELEVGVHISDVGSLIKKDDSIDIEAKERSTTYYPGEGCPPYHMLPEPIGTNMCSLLPGQKRKALSIFYRIDILGKILDYKIKPTLIKSRMRLTYCKAQEILSSKDENIDLRKELCHLRDICRIFRSDRLGNKVFSFPFEPFNASSESYFQSLDAHHIVEELMILVNKTVGQDLIKTFPDCIPLRVQPAPSACKIREWLQQYPVIGHFVLSLQQQNLPTNDNLSFENVLDGQNSKQLPIQKYVWKKIESDFKLEEYENVERWIGTDQYHPQQAMAYDSWISFQETSSYQCSGASHDKSHFSLGIYPYLHFTSPIRRYADLIVNRLVHAMLNNKKSPYTRNEMELICRKINSQSRAFKKQCLLLHLARKLQNQPIMFHSLLNSASDNAMSLCFPGLKELTKSSGQIQFSFLKLKSKPYFEKSMNTDVLFTLSWIQRLYSPYAYASFPGGTVSRREPVKLDPHQRVIFLSLQKWKKLLDHLVNKNIKFLDMDTFEKETLVKCRECEGTHTDVTSESKDGIIKKLQSEFSLTFSKGQVIPVQIGYEKKGGLPVPEIQMLELTNNFKCCIQHMSDPVRCFAVYSNVHAGNRRMTSSEYIQRWLKIFRMESATNAAKSTSIIINDLRVNFQNEERYDGSFVLLKTFCMERDIYIEYAWNDEQNDDKERIISFQTDFLCIRCEMVKGVPSKSKAGCPPNERWIWIGHGETKCFQIGKENENIKVHFNLHKDACKPTASMTDHSARDKLTCTVEILPMADADKHIEKALAGLDKATPLARSIALKEKRPSLDETHCRLATQIGYDVNSEDMQRNNEKQSKAIKQALTSRFSLIQGPPGTGKTLTGIKLIILFNRINLKHREEGGDHKQVVYCGPSNKSVDLVAKWMKTYIPDICPKIVRMYGNSMENMVYPIPNREYINQRSCKDNRPDSDLDEISLHTLIRKKEKPYAEKLKMFENQFKNAPDEIATEDILKYKKAISMATREELKQYDVIFCTTAAALSPKFLRATDGKIFQLIIDEAGMCTEPETLAPIIATKADQVVLIGDHKQLQPIILCPEASDLGLSKSLFERYADSAVFLDTQYRMNPKICEFPSTQFYKGQLKTGPIGKWTVEKPLQIWQRPDVPLLFCHIEGEEECLSVTTEEGNQQSRSNRAEVDHVVKVYEYLMSHDKMDRHHVKVMSQYNAQCFAIRDALKTRGFINSNVTTAVSSQGGEWDYVIFSAVRSLPKFRIESNRNKGWCKKNLGFITDAHQINVVLTRARKGIIIIGNKNLLQCDETWEALIKHYTSLGCMVDAEDQNLTPLKRPGRRY